MAILEEVLRTFYRPTRGQARWVDPQPLAHQRTDVADSVEVPDRIWALAIVQAAQLARVCVLGEPDDGCFGRPGGVLRFSRAYRVGTDRAVVFARYDAMAGGTRSRSRWEMEFTMAPAPHGWRILSKRTLTH